MTALTDILSSYREAAQTNRESGTYFEELTICYLRTEPSYRDLYRQVWTYGDWAKHVGRDGRDVGIDLVAETFTGEVHAIQCKLYEEDHRIQKSDIDSFFTASGQKPFTHRIIVTTTNEWSEHADDALRDQQPPVTKIDLAALEESVIDWSAFAPDAAPTVKTKKTPRPHQRDALQRVLSGLKDSDRGKLIMACGTGKTFTSLKIAEEQAGAGKRVLFLVPSLALLSQTLTEWTQESETPLHSFAVCSDTDVGKKRRKNDDLVQTFAHELRYPATTNAKNLAKEMAERHDAKHMSVVYATYHSIDVLHQAQHEHGLAPFDLVICDEAHRTTGAKFEGEDESTFIRVHNADYIRANKRLYMTATPRIYGDSAKATAERDDVILCSMDDEELYGQRLYVLTFSEAVKRDLLVDYKVLVLSVEEGHVSRRLQSLLKDENNQLRVDDAAKIVGCWKALAKLGLEESLAGDPDPMKRAVAFCQVIEARPTAKTHKVGSKNIAGMFRAVVEAYEDTNEDEDASSDLRCEAEHIDGSMNASQKEEKLTWLKEQTEHGVCRILSNVRCLSEGVDVPALDAVLFLTPRNSQVDVVQSVGRVMRKAPGKTRGYIVLPVVIPAGLEPDEALSDNQTYRVVWQVLQALRSHDDRFDAMVNKLDLIGKDPSKMEVIAITDKVTKRKRRTKKSQAAKAKGSRTIGSPAPKTSDEQREIEFEIGEIERAIYAKLVQKVGNRHHWEDWAKDIAKIAATHIDRIQGILENPESKKERAAFEQFAAELRDDLNDSISDDEIIEMLAQHMVTRPVFDALFADHSFVTKNPMSVAMQSVLDALTEHRLDKETSTLAGFYDSVKLRAEGIESAEGKQRIVVELYDKFFRNAFPQMSDRLGIVYTPVEIVDFILQSVDHLLREEFDQNLGSKNVHIIDPFTGTGTFITRLLQSGLIAPKALAYKYRNEIHANEIVLLAYYIAAVNIEATYNSLASSEYIPFEGICLTDTFQMHEKDDLISALLEDNSARRKRQKKLDIRVIIGNPPYSVGQRRENDNNQNVRYPSLDERIATTYAARSTAKLKTSLYDSYIRAIRWASDRIGDAGIIGFVTNATWIDGGASDGLRRCLEEEFSSLYVFHLRGNQRTSGERSRQEGGKVFGSGSRAPVAISLLVKNPKATKRRGIFFHDVGDYLSRDEKLAAVASALSVAGISSKSGWVQIAPDEHGDWLNQRDESFSKFMTLGSRDDETSVFASYSNGVKTQRDAWAYGPSSREVASNIQRTVQFYNHEVSRLSRAREGGGKFGDKSAIDSFIDADPTKISWTVNLKRELERGSLLQFDAEKLVPSLYRPYTKHWLYFDRTLNERVLQIPRFFPSRRAKNRLIGVSGGETRGGYAVLMTDVAPSLHSIDMVGSQFFPLYIYESTDQETSSGTAQSSLPGSAFNTGASTDGITDDALRHFSEPYGGTDKAGISKEDLFYYIYGILHSNEYRQRYVDNLGKELPRIPRTRRADDFWAFSRAGRELGDLHVGYEDAAPYPARLELSGSAKKTPGSKGARSDAKGTAAKDGSDVSYGSQLAAPISLEAKLASLDRTRLRVEKMKFGRRRVDGRGEKDRTTIHYNDFVAIAGIPLEAYDYTVNGKPAIQWVMEQQAVKTDKASGITKDPNDWATETASDPRYPLLLLLRVITVSLETMKIVRALPKLDILED